MTKEQNARMPNKAGTKHSDTDSGSKGANHGSSTGLRKSDEMRSDTFQQPTNKNRYPNGLA